jgi:hypothetical protein
MTLRERILYHQIHPLKLFTDIGVTFPSCYYFWRHDLMAAIAIALLPPIIVSAIIIAAADLERYKQSSFGRYLGTYMSREMEAIRLLGFILMAFGSWFHQAWLLPLGLVVAMMAWLRGIIRRRPGVSTTSSSRSK